MRIRIIATRVRPSRKVALIQPERFLCSAVLREGDCQADEAVRAFFIFRFERIGVRKRRQRLGMSPLAGKRCSKVLPGNRSSAVNRNGVSKVKFGGSGIALAQIAGAE